MDWIMSRSNRGLGAQKLSAKNQILKNFLAIRLPDCRTFCTYGIMRDFRHLGPIFDNFCVICGLSTL